MPRPHKYRPGGPIKNMAALVREVEAGRYVYYRHKPQHPAWIMGLRLWTIRWAIRDGYLSYAKKNKES